MPIQPPQWTEFLSCPVCYKKFNDSVELPISLGCGHTVCKSCLLKLHQKKCPFDQTVISWSVEELPVNLALLQLVGATVPEQDIISISSISENYKYYDSSRRCISDLASHLKCLSTGIGQMNSLLSRPMQRKLVTMINCQLIEEEGRSRAMRAARSLGERSVTELILAHQNPAQLSTNLWAAIRARGCQFLGPAMQEEVLRLILLALEDGSLLSRKVLVLFVVQRLESQYPQASKTAIGHVVQLLYRASCFKVTKREEESSLMQLKEDFRTYDSLRREHDSQVVQIATEAGLRIAPEQWSSLLYGDMSHKSHMQSIIDKLQTPQSFALSVNELVIALQRTGDTGNLARLCPHLELLANIDPSPEAPPPTWENLEAVLKAVRTVVQGLVDFLHFHSQKRSEQPTLHSTKYKTSLCRDHSQKGTCPRGPNCTFAHSQEELERARGRSKKLNVKPVLVIPPAVQTTHLPTDKGEGEDIKHQTQLSARGMGLGTTDKSSDLTVDGDPDPSPVEVLLPQSLSPAAPLPPMIAPHPVMSPRVGAPIYQGGGIPYATGPPREDYVPSNLASPGISNHGVVNHGVGSRGVASPGVGSHGAGSHNVGSFGVGSHGVANSGVAGVLPYNHHPYLAESIYYPQHGVSTFPSSFTTDVPGQYPTGVGYPAPSQPPQNSPHYNPHNHYMSGMYEPRYPTPGSYTDSWPANVSFYMHPEASYPHALPPRYASTSQLPFPGQPVRETLDDLHHRRKKILVHLNQSPVTLTSTPENVGVGTSLQSPVYSGAYRLQSVPVSTSGITLPSLERRPPSPREMAKSVTDTYVASRSLSTLALSEKKVSMESTNYIPWSSGESFTVTSDILTNAGKHVSSHSEKYPDSEEDFDLYRELSDRMREARIDSPTPPLSSTLSSHSAIVSTMERNGSSSPKSVISTGSLLEDDFFIPFDPPIVSKYGPISRTSKMAKMKSSDPVLVTAKSDSLAVTPVTAVTPTTRPYPVSVHTPSRYSLETVPSQLRAEAKPFTSMVGEPSRGRIPRDSGGGSEPYTLWESRASGYTPKIIAPTVQDRLKQELAMVEHQIHLRENSTRELSDKERLQCELQAIEKHISLKTGKPPNASLETSSLTSSSGSKKSASSKKIIPKQGPVLDADIDLNAALTPEEEQELNELHQSLQMTKREYEGSIHLDPP